MIRIRSLNPWLTIQKQGQTVQSHKLRKRCRQKEREIEKKLCFLKTRSWVGFTSDLKDDPPPRPCSDSIQLNFARTFGFRNKPSKKLFKLTVVIIFFSVLLLGKRVYFCYRGCLFNTQVKNPQNMNILIRTSYVKKLSKNQWK